MCHNLNGDLLFHLYAYSHGRRISKLFISKMDFFNPANALAVTSLCACTCWNKCAFGRCLGRNMVMLRSK